MPAAFAGLSEKGTSLTNKLLPSIELKRIREKLKLSEPIKEPRFLYNKINHFIGLFLRIYAELYKIFYPA